MSEHDTEPPTFGEAFEQANDWPAFSNGHEGQTWQGGWCGTCRHGDGGDGCALLDVAIVGRTPVQWTLRRAGGLLSKYECVVYRPERDDRDVRQYLATERAAELGS